MNIYFFGNNLVCPNLGKLRYWLALISATIGSKPITLLELAFVAPELEV